MSDIATSKLGDVAEFVRGITFKPHDVVPSGTAGSVQCMRTKNVQSHLDLSDVWSVDSRFVKRPDQYLQTGDLLVSSANSWNLVGKCSWVPKLKEPATFGGFVSVLRANELEILPRYLYHWFTWGRTQTTIRSFGRQTTNISNLNLARCLAMDIPAPPMAEQQRVAEVLDRVDELRARRREAIALLDDLTQSIFLDMFGSPQFNPNDWKMTTFDQLVREFRYGTSNKSASNGIPTLRIPNVVAGDLDIADLKTVPVTSNELDRLRLKDGDLLFVRTNGNPDYVGRCAIFTEKSVASSNFPADEFIYASYLIRARPNQEVANPVYLREFMLGEFARSQMRDHSKTSAGQFNINIRGIGAIRLPIPPLDKQREFEGRVAQLNAVRRIHRAHLTGLDELFGSVQQRAFRGDLWDR